MIRGPFRPVLMRCYQKAVSRVGSASFFESGQNTDTQNPEMRAGRHFWTSVPIHFRRLCVGIGHAKPGNARWAVFLGISTDTLPPFVRRCYLFAAQRVEVVRDQYF